LYSIDVATKLSEKCAEFKKEGKLQQNDPKYVEWEKKKSDEMKEIEAVSQFFFLSNYIYSRTDSMPSYVSSGLLTVPPTEKTSSKMLVGCDETRRLLYFSKQAAA
jgi:hypothetical protein